MQNVTEAYKEAMKLPLRNRSDMRIVIGDVNMTAQLSAESSVGYSKEIYYANMDSIFKNNANIDYSTLEQDFTPADGSMFFTPRENSGMPYFETGYTSNLLMDTTMSGNDLNYIAFFDDIDAPSASNPFVANITFSDKGAPTTASIFFQWDDSGWYGWGSVDVVDNKVRVMSTSAPTGYSKITGLWVRGAYTTASYRRLRIKSITFGDGAVIYSDIIEKSEQTDYTSHINENLPTRDFKCDLINYDARYDADNPNNPLAILDEAKQTLNVYYGYDVTGQGGYEWLHGGKFIVDSWSSGKYRASIMAKDELQNNDRLFIHSNTNLGRFARAGYWLEFIMNCLSPDPNHPIEYEYDSDMDDIIMDLTVVRTLPAKQILQMLANYCCKTLYIDNDGKVIISSNQDEATDFEMTSYDVLDDMQINKEELIKEVCVPYYSFGYIPTDETVLVDEVVEITENGYTYEQSFGDTIYGFVDVQVSEYPPIATVSDLSNQQYTNRVLTSLFPVTYGDEYIMEVDHTAQLYVITEHNSSGTEINRLMIQNWGYLYTPSSSSVTQIRVYVRYADDSPITPSDLSFFRVEKSVIYQGYPDEPLDYWYGMLNIGTYHIRITAGGYFKFTSALAKYQVNDTGKTLTWDNPLIGTQARALEVAQFVGDYLKSNLSYNYKYRGNPELNANDVITQENDFIADMEVTVSEHKIGFNGALSGEITARRRAEG